MVVASSLVGILAAWLLVTLAGIGGGYGLVSAWRRWGERVALPPTIKQGMDRVLGEGNGAAGAPPQETAATETRATDTADRDAPAEDGPEPQPDTAPQTPVEETQDPDRTEPTYQLTRGDAIEEISLLFDAPYEASNALVRSGLWGMENHEEWARAMRGKPAPEGVPPELFKRVVDTSPKDHQQELEKIRAKRTAMVQLRSLWGVGPQEAEALYKAGFATVEAIRATSSEKLAKVPGIGQALAFQMRAAAHGLAPSP